MSLSVAILLIILGLILLLLEILVIPGIVVGILGVCLSLAGIASVYINQGVATGHLVLAGTVIVSIAMLYFAFRSGTWKKVSLNTSLEGKVNTFNTNNISVGDTGIAISRLAPSGKAMINNNQYEVHSMEGFVAEESEIVVVKIKDNKIIIKSKS